MTKYRKYNMNEEQFKHYDEKMPEREKELFDRYRRDLIGLDYREALNKVSDLYERDSRLKYLKANVKYTPKKLEEESINFKSDHEDREEHIINDCVFGIVFDLKRAKYFRVGM